LEKWADLLLFAVGFEGGNLEIQFEREARDLALLVARKAAELGAACVDFEYLDHGLRAAAIRAGRAEYEFPRFLEDKYREISAAPWSKISIPTNGDMDAYDGLPQEAATAYVRAMNALKEPHTAAITSNRIPWTVSFAPSTAMAGRSFPELTAAEAVLRYEDAVAAILRLDDPDPIAYWRRKMEETDERSSALNSWDIRLLRFRGPGTDFELAPAVAARWIGGFDRTADGKAFMANIPTEEVFTTPDCRTASGRVALTRPFEMHQNLGPRVEGAWFEFDGGKVVDFDADRGRETLDAFFSLDERARYLGEVAIVDPFSAIARTGFNFHNGLYDENAACHVALGRSYAFTLKEPGERSRDELLAIGFNQASVHEDMMIGGPEVDVEAVLEDGSVKPVIRNGKILI
jgi:aminopeptidase